MELRMVLPSDEHIKELKEKGIDAETELARVVFDNVNRCKNGLGPRVIAIGITQEQIKDIEEYGIDVAGQVAAEFKKEMHECLEKHKSEE